jgi:hypothetical protein
MKRERDTQRARFYKAVKVLKAFETPLPEMADIRGYVGRLRENAMIKRRHPAVSWNVEIKDGRGVSRSIGYPTTNEITFPRHDRTNVAVCHCYAYIVAYRTSKLGAWHGWHYCSILMDLVRFGIGAEAAAALKKAFDDEGVRYSKPVKRVLSKEQKVVAVERGEKLAKLRKDQLARERFSKEYPEAPVLSKEEFGGDWEDIYRLWRP